jgi:hypothetical protein
MTPARRDFVPSADHRSSINASPHYFRSAQKLTRDIFLRSTFPRPVTPTARAGSAASTPSTRSPSTRLARPPYSPRESAVTTASSPVTVVRLSLSSTRRPRPPRRLCCDWSASSARPSANWLSSVASTSSWVVTRRQRVLLWCSKRVVWGLGVTKLFPRIHMAAYGQHGHNWRREVHLLD